MLDLDKYLNQGLDIKIDDKVVTVKQPTAAMVKEIRKIENTTTEKNDLDNKTKITQLLLDNNTSGKKFSSGEVDKIPFKVQDIIIAEIFKFVAEADNDPN